ncbi:2,3-bisphosphoglycerate-independent phosphoglycerate mutase [Chloroflexota bacterium]
MTDYLELIKQLAVASPTKIVLLVIDGLGGLPSAKTGKSELETANTPNLDQLAVKSICGFADPISPGITPGSAPGHLGVFGYDPVKWNIGRGVLETVGIDFDLQAGDVVARGNFCTVDTGGLITDRRAGRIPTEKCIKLCHLLDGMTVDGVKVIVRPVREHRFVIIFRGKDLVANVTESDPQRTGVAPKRIEAMSQEAHQMASIANQSIAKAKARLADQHPANMVLLRGFSQHPQLLSMKEVYKLKPAVIAVYPMYRGLAKLVGMETLPAGKTIEDEFMTLKQHYNNHDFFFLHIKGTDSAGEDGDFEKKVKIFEEIDRALPQIIKLKPDVLVIAGDHSTPAVLKGHSWHPVPVLLYSRHCRPDKVTEFSESAFSAGGLGRFPATQIMPLAMANALKLTKFGA